MVKVTLSKPKKLEHLTFTRQDMLKIGAAAINAIQRRCATARDIMDRPMRPLSAKYAAAKKKLGQPAKRNMMFSGSMLGSMAVVEAAPDRCVIGFTRREELEKAIANQNRSPWFGLSPSDEATVAQFADRILRSKAR